VRYQVSTEESLKLIAFWDIAPCSLVAIDRRFKGEYCLHHQALMMEAVSTSATSFYFKESLRRYVPEGYLSSSSLFTSLIPFRLGTLHCFFSIYYGVIPLH
jgi:hypothetical protein